MKKLLKDNLVKRIVFSGIVLIFVYWIFNNLAMFGSVIGNFVGIIMPFITGLVIAFIFNVPMRFIEKRLFRNKSNSYRVSTRIASFLLTLLIVITIIWLILFFMIPQLSNSFSMLNENITDFVPQFQSSMEHLNKKVPLVKHLMGMQTFDTQQILQTVSDFLKDSAKTITGSTISAIGSVFQGIVTGFLAFAFA